MESDNHDEAPIATEVVGQLLERAEAAGGGAAHPLLLDRFGVQEHLHGNQPEDNIDDASGNRHEKVVGAIIVVSARRNVPDADGY